MAAQCEEFRKTVQDLRDKLSKDEDSVTLKSVELAFSNTETVYRIGTDNKGTPVTEAIKMRPPPQVPATKAGLGKPKHPKPRSDPPHDSSPLWPEKTAESKYGAKGSHKKGACSYGSHRNETDHCWSGCAKCGGCVMYHKRQRMLNEGAKLCTFHKFAVHLEADCKRKGKGNQFKNYSNKNRDNSRQPDRDSRERGRSSSRHGAKRPYQARSSSKTCKALAFTFTLSFTLSLRFEIQDATHSSIALSFAKTQYKRQIHQNKIPPTPRGFCG